MQPPSKLASIVKHLEENADVRLDTSYRQSRGNLRRQLEHRSGQNEEERVDRFIESIKRHMAYVRESIAPYRLPSDYTDFLEWYGGLALFGPDERFYLSVDGIGPMVEDWYPGLLGESKIIRDDMRAFLPIARLSFRTGPPHRAVDFYMVFAQHIDTPSIIGVGPTDDEPHSILFSVEHDDARQNLVKPLASTFAEWLNMAGTTGGSFNY